MTSNNTPASSASSANSAAAAAGAAANANNADTTVGGRFSKRVRARLELELERGTVRNVDNEKKVDTPSSKNKRATAAVASVSASVSNTSATTANGDTQSLPSSEAIAKKEEKENENNSALGESTPKKKPSLSPVLRPSPIINATDKLKGPTAANDHDAAANDDDAAMVDKVGGILGQLPGANFPEQAINFALSVTDNDPNRAAYFLHSKGKSEKTADVTDPPPKRLTRAANRPKSSIKGKSIVSDTMSSLMMLRQLSLPGPSMIAAVPFDQFVPRQGVHWDDSNKDRNKMSMAAKSAKGVSVRCGYAHQEDFRREGEDDVTDMELRFARALSICEMNEQSQLVQVTPNPFGLNASERCGWFGECAECEKQFQCCHDSSTTEAVQFKYKWFRRHKLQCGREDVCPCGLNAAQIADALRRVNNECTTRAVEIHMAKCIDPCDYIQRIDDYQELVKSLVNGLDASEETKNEFLKKYLGLPNQRGLEAMLKKLGISAEKKKELLKIWPAKVCRCVYNYSSDRMSATRFTTKEMKDALERAGLSVEKVVAA